MCFNVVKTVEKQGAFVKKEGRTGTVGAET